MANENQRRGNTWYINTTGALETTKGLRVAYILFTPSVANDSLVLEETSGSGNIVELKGPTANKTEYFDFSSVPLVFPNGIYVKTIDNGDPGATSATLVLTSRGGG